MEESPQERAAAQVQRMALLSPDLVIGGEIDFDALQRRLERSRPQAAVNMIREYAEEIIATVREPLLVLDGMLRVKAANQAFLRTFGVSAEDTMGCFIYDLGNGQWDIPALRTLLSDILPINAVVHDFEVDHVFPGIGRRLMLLDGRMIVRGGHDSVILLAMEDVTERRRAERVLSEHDAIRAFASDIIATVREPLLVLDGALRVKAVNQAFLRMFGVSADETTGCFIYDLGNGQWDIPALRTLLSEILPINSVVHDFEVDHEFPNIGRRMMLLDGRMIVRGGTEDSMILLAMEDVTVRRRAERLLSEHAIIMARSNRDLEEFASVASHDLQEPLRSIQAFTDRLRSRHAENLDVQGRDYLERVHGAARRMKELITALLTFARVGTRSAAFVAVDLSSVARDVVKDMANLCEEKSGQIEVGELPTLHGDAVQMRQLLQNLISNGMKFQRPDQPPHIVVKGRLVKQPGRSTREDSTLCELTVQDNGIGFDEKYLDRIFTIFERLHGRGQYEGSGVGLAICRRIAERHGGTISASSTPGKGATFTVTLPLRHTQDLELAAS